MKKLITSLAAVATLAVLMPATSQAFDGHGHSSSRSYSHNCGSCGTPVYRERAVTGYDRHGHPVYGYRAVGHSCRPASGHGGGFSPGYGSSHGPSRSGSGGGAHISLPGFHADFGGRGRH